MTPESLVPGVSYGLVGVTDLEGVEGRKPGRIEDI